jgi:hypothetical protein
MKYAVVSVGNEMEQSFPLEGFQMLSNGTHSSRLILFVENFCCSIKRKILTGFETGHSVPEVFQFFSLLVIGAARIG